MPLDISVVDTRVQSAIEMRQIAEPYIRRKAIRHLEKGRVVIFAAGTGNPIFLQIPLLLCVLRSWKRMQSSWRKKVDGVYSADPKVDPKAKKFDTLEFMDIIEKELGVMDSTAASLCKDNKIPIVLFNINTKGKHSPRHSR